jgi:GNAT superfamily N-acetyltransferase
MLDAQHMLVRDLWNAANPAWPLDDLALASRPLTHLHIAEHAGQPVGFVAIAPPPKPWLAAGAAGNTDSVGHIRLLAVHPAHQRQGVGRSLLAWAEASLRQQGATRVVVGGEVGHYLPSTPASANASHALLEQAGYSATARNSNDVARNLADISDLPALTLPAHVVVGFSDPASVVAFVAREFSPRWAHDVGATLAQDPQQCLALLVDGQVLGFALVGLRSDPAILPGCLWPSEDCGLGPIGVAASLRGQGLGLGLLLAATRHLAARGGRRMGIDWTDIVPFYQKLGFEVVRQYKHYQKELG